MMPHPVADDDKKGVSRRELLTFWRRPLDEAVKGMNKAVQSATTSSVATPTLAKQAPLRPPGMMHELMLRNTCMRCGKCIEICPAEAISPLGPEWGRLAETPAIDARKQPCVLCEGLQCTHVCPSGALIPVYTPGDVVMGTAVVDESRCLPYGGLACDQCLKACPIPGALVADAQGRPSVVEDLCVGCGLCEQHCPTEPTSIRVRPRN